MARPAPRYDLLRNDPARAGQLAHCGELFGEFSRYRVAPVHTRFDALQWWVWDVLTPDEDGRPSVIRQAATLAGAAAGL